MTAPVMIFLDGKVVPADPPLLERLRPGRFRLNGVFETLRVVDGRLLFAREHFARMRRGLAALGLESPCPLRAFPEIIDWLVAIRHLRDARVRVSVWFQRGKARCAVTAEPFSPPEDHVYHAGWRAVTVVVRGRILRPGPEVKSLDYGVFARALAKARREGCDEALLCRPSGEIIEGSRTNVFLARQGEVLTPSLASQCLRGVTRQVIMRIARARGLRVRQARVDREQLLATGEVFVCNSLLGIMRLGCIDGVKIGGLAPGPVITTLSADYAKLVREQAQEFSSRNYPKFSLPGR